MNPQKKAREEAEKKTKEKEQILSPEERRAEQLRQQRLQEEADLRLAMDTLGLSNLVDFSSRKPQKSEKPDKNWQHWKEIATILIWASL